MTIRTCLLFAILCLFWGVPYFFIKLALVGLSPVCVAWGRITLGALLLLPIAWQRGTLAGAAQHRAALAAFAVLELVIPFTLIAVAETELTSSLTGVLIAAVPLMILAIAPAFGVRETLSLRRLGGLVVGFAGVIVLLGLDAIAGAAQWTAVAVTVIAIAGYAAGPLIVQRHLAGVDAIASVALSLAVASVILLPLAWLTRPRVLPPALSLASVAVLGLISTAGALLLYFRVIHAAGAARASLVAYVSPAIAAVLGITVLHEPWGAGMALGFALILAGSYFGSSGSSARSCARRP